MPARSPRRHHEGRGRRRPGALLQPGQGPGTAGPAALPGGGLALLLSGLRLRAHGQRAGQPLRALLRQVGGRRRAAAGGRRLGPRRGGSARGARGPSAGRSASGHRGGRGVLTPCPAEPPRAGGNRSQVPAARLERHVFRVALAGCASPGGQGPALERGLGARLDPRLARRCPLGTWFADSQVQAATQSVTFNQCFLWCVLSPPPPQPSRRLAVFSKELNET